MILLAVLFNIVVDIVHNHDIAQYCMQFFLYNISNYVVHNAQIRVRVERVSIMIYCTHCTELYKLFEILHEIVTVWFADVGPGP